VASLAWSVWITATDQAFAYFDTRARLWEFAFGSLLALVATRRTPLAAPGTPLGTPGSRWRTAIGWLGLATVLLVGVVVNVRNAFPGWIALIPLTAAAAIVLVGDDPGRWGVGRLLGHPWLAGLGNASYALYLVHWPILIAYLVALDSDRPSLLAGGVIIAGSVLLAIGLHAFFTRTRQGLRLAAVAEDHRTAMSLGVSVRSAIATAWILGTLVATAAAIVLLSGRVVSLEVAHIGFKALPVALLGGLESIRGAPLAGILIGIGEALAMAYLDPLTNGAASGLLPYVVMITVLLVRPQGLFGWKRIERL